MRIFVQRHADYGFADDSECIRREQHRLYWLQYVFACIFFLFAYNFNAAVAVDATAFVPYSWMLLLDENTVRLNLVLSEFYAIYSHYKRSWCARFKYVMPIKWYIRWLLLLLCVGFLRLFISFVSCVCLIFNSNGSAALTIACFHMPRKYKPHRLGYIVNRTRRGLKNDVRIGMFVVRNMSSHKLQSHYVSILVDSMRRTWKYGFLRDIKIVGCIWKMITAFDWGKEVFYSLRWINLFLKMFVWYVSAIAPWKFECIDLPLMQVAGTRGYLEFRI